jgi:hypothetical protein
LWTEAQPPSHKLIAIAPRYPDHRMIARPSIAAVIARRRLTGAQDGSIVATARPSWLILR